MCPLANHEINIAYLELRDLVPDLCDIRPYEHIGADFYPLAQPSE